MKNRAGFTLLPAALLILVHSHVFAATPRPVQGGGTNRLTAPRLTGPVPAGTFFFVQTNQDGSLSVVDNQATLAKMKNGTNGVDLSLLVNQVRIQNPERPAFRIQGNAAWTMARNRFG